MANSEVQLMNAKVSDALLKVVEVAEPQQEISVIVTTTAGANLTALEQKGLKIQYAAKNSPIVSGTLTAAEVNELSQLDEVERIEPDSEVSASKDEQGPIGSRDGS
jgi:hypothetical protein